MTSLKCPKCHTPFLDEAEAEWIEATCPKCKASLESWVFPAYSQQTLQAARAEQAFGEDATCFFHDGSKAVIACEHCGRFLCALCDIELNGTHYCSSCLETGRKKGRLQTLERGRFLWGSTALMLAALPLLLSLAGLWIFIPMTAPAALFCAIYGWKRPGSLVKPGHGSHIIAIVLATLQIIGMIAGVFFFFAMLRERL